MAKGKFIKEFLFKKGNKVGALSPSSKFLANKMLNSVDFNKAKHIVELGPGTGPMTKALLKRMHPDAKLYAFELSDTFCDELKEKYKDDRLHIINASAEDLRKIMKEQFGIEKADCVISSLPFTIISKDVTQRIMNEVTHIIDHNGVFVQFQYSFNAYRMFKDVFDSVKINFTALNIPPAIVYTCKVKPQENK